MQNIIPKVSRALLDKELTKDIFFTETNNGGNELYIFSAHNRPNLMREVARLREITFREAGGGTGKEMDMDSYDTSEVPFQQLIVWNPTDKEIVGGYRFICGKKISIINGEVKSPTTGLFRFSKEFVNDYLPQSIELGRSFVQPNYQPNFNLRKGMYSLDNLWDGLGAISVEHPEIKYLYGKMTMYTDYNIYARDTLLYFLRNFFPDNRSLITPRKAIELKYPDSEFEKIFTGTTYEENYKILVRTVRKHKENIPPLFNAYMNLSASMMIFGTAVNYNFGEVEETGMLITIDDIYEKKKHRYFNSYIKKLQKNIKSLRHYRYDRKNS
ncbi:MAG: GNAT family N-acetyltransferase [Bacteroidales bacterium]|nr:GNAT family N-acetyltransferase [Bacteroidales bacterium]